MMDVKYFVENNKYDTKMSVQRMLGYLVAAKELGNEDQVRVISNDILQKPATHDFLEKFLDYKWAKYGLEDLRFVYTIATKHECIKEMLVEIRRHLESMTWDYLIDTYNDKGIEDNDSKFLNHYLSTRMAGSYKNWFLKVANQRLPELTRRNVDDYVHMRNVTNKSVDFRIQTDSEIVAICEQYGIYITERKCENMRAHFGYMPMDTSSLSLSWYHSKGTKAKRLKQLGAHMITNDMIHDELAQIQRVLNYSSADISVLYDWVYRVATTCDDSNANVTVTDELKERYAWNKICPGKHAVSNPNSDSKIFARMRAEIRTAFEDGKINGSPVQRIICSGSAKCNLEIRCA